MTEDPKRSTQTEIDSGILGTARIDPERYSAQRNRSLWERAKYAIAGLLHLFARHRSFSYISVATLVIIGLGFWLRVSTMGWALLVLNIGQVWIAEIFNSSVEAVTDLVTEGEIRSLAKVAKDVAAAGTLIASIVFLATNALVLIPPLVARF